MRPLKTTLALLLLCSLGRPVEAQRRRCQPSVQTLKRNAASKLGRHGAPIGPRIPKLTRARFNRLARDPAHGGKITPNSRREAVVGIKLERLGALPAPIRRERSGRAEFIDGKGQLWDVKGFRSDFPKKSGGFVLERAMHKLVGQFRGGENVILDTAHLSRKHEKQLRRAIHKQGFSDRVLFFP